jgi:excisionase family DNA binding protein
MTNLEKPIENGKQPAVYLTVEEHYALIRQAVRAELSHATPAEPVASSSKEMYFNYAKAVEYLQVSKPTFGKLRAEKKVKGIKVSERRVLFPQSELDAYLLSKHE